MKRSFNAAQVPTTIALESVQVASPCHADWDAMRGDDRSRFCPSCAKNVYNLSAMTRDEAQLLLQEKEGRLCVRFFQREDGTMLTQDCPVGVAALKERSPSFALWAGVASLLVLLGALASPTLVTGAHAQPEPQAGVAPAQLATPTPEPTPGTIGEPELMARMGDVAGPLPTTNPQATPTVASAAPNPEVMGQLRAPVSPQATPASSPNQPLMGKPVMPTPTLAPKTVPTVMGRIAAPAKTPVPTPVPSPQKAPVAMMGMVASSTRPHPQVPAKKPITSNKKTRAATRKPS